MMSGRESMVMVREPAVRTNALRKVVFVGVTASP